ncbi:MAG: helix-turn-helix transcriptional regulator [Prevotellaceae bacterium]|jgi:transcriptional regulator with XRE-family HTH domain|nr:helix-turn-helix transcriptional regulator [Prevotellaceae bacterium]
MIHNKKQLTAAQKGIAILTEKIKALSASKEVFDRMQVHAWKCRIEDLTGDIEEFQFLENASELTFSNKIGSKEDLLKAAISLRIASGMTQKQLAEAIMVQEQQIQRYEQDCYRTASFERIVQILRVLSKDIQLKIELKKAKIVSFSSSFSEQIEQVRKTVQERGTFIAC